MWPGDLAPDDADLGSTDLLLAAVDEGNLLAEVEAVVGISVSTRKIRDSSWPVGVLRATYLAAEVSSTPSILIRLVPGLVTWRERW